jgi:CBS domain-containing protein
MAISECCNMDVVSCGPDASVPEVAALMRKHHVGDVIVIEKGNDSRVPIGIVTDRDIVIETVALDLDVKIFTASDIMNAPIVTVHTDMGLLETLRTMRDNKIRRMPVVNDSGELFGIVTADDIINLLTMELSLMTAAIVEQPARESRLRK